MNILKNILLIILVTGMSYCSFAQQVEVKSNFWGTKITNNQEKINIKEFIELTKSNKTAHEYALKAKENKGTGELFSAIGGFMIGWPIGQAIAGGEFKPELLIAGVGVACISIPFTSGMSKNLKKARDAFNGKSVAYHTEYSFIANANGIGLSLNF